MQQCGILDLDREGSVTSSVEMQLNMIMLTPFSENFLESLMLHKGSAASATGYYLCTVHRGVHSSLFTAVLGCTYVRTHL